MTVIPRLISTNEHDYVNGRRQLYFSLFGKLETTELKLFKQDVSNTFIH